MSYRPELVTLVEDIESPSLPPRHSSEKDRVLLTLLTGPLQGSILQLNSTEVTLGRSRSATLFIPDPGLSRIHARLVRAEGEAAPAYCIEDCGSTNGTFVRGKRIEQRVRLRDGDRIGLGRRTVLRYSLQDPLEEQALVRVHRSALQDRLTGVFNRGAFDDHLQSEFAASLRRGTPLAVCLLDVDHFKRLNDTHGHAAGDAVLQMFARTLQGLARGDDVVGRYGGEEFAVVMRGVSQRAAGAFAEIVRATIEQQNFFFADRQLKVTVSIGVAHTLSARDAESPSWLVQSADAALYAAKHLGRNRVVVAE